MDTRTPAYDGDKNESARLTQSKARERVARHDSVDEIEVSKQSSR